MSGLLSGAHGRSSLAQGVGAVTERWSTLAGWTPDPRRPGFLKNTACPGWARTGDGRWWSQRDIDAAIRVVSDACGNVMRLELPSDRTSAEATHLPRGDMERARMALRRLLKEGAR